MTVAAVTLDDHRLAAELAVEAGQLLLQLRVDGAGLHPSTLRDEGDGRAHRLLAARLADVRPHDGLLSEEGVDSARRLGRERVWIVDPLDGTREYGEPPRPDWAVHVALWTREAGDLVASAVALPALGTVLTTDDPRGGAPAPAPHQGRPRLAVSRSRATETVRVLAEELDLELVPLGSAGYKASAVVLGQVDAYVHTGGQYEWDSAAPVAVARAAGLHTSRVDGSPLVYNRSDPKLPDLVVCRPDLASDILTVLKRLHPEEAL